jgi:hypothetical protein
MSDKKMGLVDGLIVGGGFFLGYFLTKWLVAALLIATVLWGTCALVAYNDSKGRTDPVTRKLVKLLNVPEVRFESDCALRELPRSTSSYLGSVTTGHTYKVIDQKGSWRKVIVSGLDTGWTKCSLEKI